MKNSNRAMAISMFLMAVVFIMLAVIWLMNGDAVAGALWIVLAIVCAGLGITQMKAAKKFEEEMKKKQGKKLLRYENKVE